MLFLICRDLQMLECYHSHHLRDVRSICAFAHELLRPFHNTFTSLAVAEKRYRCLMNVPLCSSVMACRNCSWVFMTIGPYHATGSSIGLPDTKRKRMPSSPA